GVRSFTSAVTGIGSTVIWANDTVRITPAISTHLPIHRFMEILLSNQNFFLKLPLARLCYTWLKQNRLLQAGGFRHDQSLFSFPSSSNKERYFSYPSFFKSSLGIKRRAAELMQYRSPFGAGPSLET